MDIEMYKRLQDAEATLMQIDEMMFEHADFGTFVWKDENQEELTFFITNSEINRMLKTLNKLRKK